MRMQHIYEMYAYIQCAFQKAATRILPTVVQYGTRRRDHTRVSSLKSQGTSTCTGGKGTVHSPTVRLVAPTTVEYSTCRTCGTEYTYWNKYDVCTVCIVESRNKQLTVCSYASIVVKHFVINRRLRLFIISILHHDRRNARVRHCQPWRHDRKSDFHP
jgi:hypothetical protein